MNPALSSKIDGLYCNSDQRFDRETSDDKATRPMRAMRRSKGNLERCLQAEGCSESSVLESDIVLDVLPFRKNAVREPQKAEVTLQ